VETREVDESFPEELQGEAIAVFLAEKKAAAFEGELKKEELVITSDTVVWAEDVVLNKPEDRDEAYAMLRLLSGGTHQVFTGVCLQSTEKKISFYEVTEVSFRDLSDEEIWYYIDRYQPYDKAGSYGIQEWIGYVGITEIKGCFYNVMGLPLQKLYDQLMDF
jgi:septum formation protein